MSEAYAPGCVITGKTRFEASHILTTSCRESLIEKVFLLEHIKNISTGDSRVRS